LILFGSVQITIILVGLVSGTKLHYFEWLGVVVSFSGFVYLVMPGVTAPSLIGFCLMSLAGIAWGFYTLAGKDSVNPLSDTSYNFLRTLPLVLILVVLTFQFSDMSQKGILLAVLSGGIASGVGYTIWYSALGGLSVIQAAVVQLLVPVIASVGGVVFANETFSLRLGISSLLILTGILSAIVGRHYSKQKIVNKA
jgi:drug/metabolite transporter (DMT)-like permease